MDIGRFDNKFRQIDSYGCEFGRDRPPHSPCLGGGTIRIPIFIITNLRIKEMSSATD